MTDDVANAAGASGQKLSTSLMAGYGVGQIGGQIFRDAPAVLLPVFLTTMLGVPAWLAGLSILAPKLWVIFCDPLVGAYSDRRKPQWGRRPFLLVGGILSGVTFFLLFVPPDFASPWAAAAYNTFMFTVASTGFSIFSVPYLTLASEMSEDKHERTKLISYRLVFTAVGLMIGAGFAQPMIGWYGGGRTGYALMAATLGAICLVSMVACYLGTKRARIVDVPSESLTILRQFRMAARNQPFVIIAGAYFMQQLGAASGYTVLALFFIFVIQDVKLIAPFIFVIGVTAMLIQAPWVWVSRKIGKIPTYVLCILGFCVTTLTWIWAEPGSDVLLTLPVFGPISTQGALLLLRAFVIGVFNSGFVLMAFSLLTDTIEFDRKRSGISREGVFSGVFSALEKLAFALGPAVTGVVLSAMGFAESKGGAVGQSSAAIAGIIVGIAVIPVVFDLASLLLLRLYRVD